MKNILKRVAVAESLRCLQRAGNRCPERGEKKADLKEMHSAWMDLWDDLYIINYRSCRIKCGCVYLNSQLPLDTTQDVSFPFPRSLGCNKTARLPSTFGILVPSVWNISPGIRF